MANEEINQFPLLADVITPDGTELNDLPAVSYIFQVTPAQKEILEAQQDGEYKLTFYYNIDGTKERFTGMEFTNGFAKFGDQDDDGNVICYVEERSHLDRMLNTLSGNIDFLAMMLDIDLDAE